MNKKLLLVTLPILLAMTGCQSARINDQPENKALVADMVEDTLAHEDVFGGAEDTHIFKANPSKATLADSAVKIGCQIQFDNKNTESTADDTISIRFLAALADGNVTAVWHRGLARSNGFEGYNVGTEQEQNWKYKFSGETNPTNLTSNVQYDALNNGGSRIVANQGDYVGYECFVIYTLRNIPYEQFKDSYLAAYVTLGSNNSKALAVKIEKDGDYPKNSFSFDPTITGHFLEGTIGGKLYDGGSNGLYRESGNTPSGNYAWYEKISLLSSDSFGSFYYGADGHFQFFGYSDFFNTASSRFDESSPSGYASPKVEGKYNLYISSSTENHIFADKLYYVTFYVDTTKLDNWSPSASGYFIHAYGTEDYTGTWGSATMSLVAGEEHLYSYELQMVDGKIISHVQLGFYQNTTPKKSISISCSISTSGAYDITYDDSSWPNDEMSASLSAHQ